MSYANETPTYNIESIGAGEFVSESSEERSANIIETQLMPNVFLYVHL